MALKIISRRVSNIQPICLDYFDLLHNKDLSKEVEAAYSKSGIGLLAVKNIPTYSDKRKKLLPLARQLALLPDEQKVILERPQYNYSVGWSHGKENFMGQPDYSKGSFYANPERDNPPEKDEWPDNTWPKQSLPDLEPAFKSLGKLMIQVGSLLARHLDNFILQKVKSYKPNTLYEIVSSHQSHVGRLLHYFPHTGTKQEWCGWHNDHGGLTALTSSMYIEQSTGNVFSPNEINDQNVGLFVRNRKGEKLKISADADSLCFQIGETAQILSGGILQATPHGVINQGKLEGISRNTFALFLEPRGYYKMNAHDQENVFIEHEGVPSLRKRWNQGMTFKEFHVKTFALFY